MCLPGQLSAVPATAGDAVAMARAGLGWLAAADAAALTSAEQAECAACDATIVPVVSGHVDPEVLDRLAAALLHGTRPGVEGLPGVAGVEGVTGGLPGEIGRAAAAGMSPARWRRSQRAARQLLLRAAADLLSGPAGLAACLRTSTWTAWWPRSACRWTSAPPPRPSRFTCAAR